MSSYRLGRGQYVGYGLGATGTAGFGTVPGLVLAIYLTDTLGVAADTAAPTAHLLPAPEDTPRPHDSHKGSWGDVAVVGGASGMTGAALLAARAALHGGAGRVFPWGNTRGLTGPCGPRARASGAWASAWGRAS